MQQRSSNSFVHYLPFLLTLITLFLLSFIIRKGDDVLFINGHHTVFLDVTLPVVSLLGEGLPFTLLLLATLFIRFQYTIATAIAWVSHGLLVSLCKQVLFSGMLRPRNYLDHSALYFVPGVDVYGHNSFPSGHTATAFCLALLIALIFQKKIIGVLVLFVALAVAYSRIYMLQHFLIDIAAGAIIGSFTTYAVWEILSIRKTPTWMERRLRLPIQKQTTTSSDL
jgi:membrane-associated phospholipid phosphatase